MPRHLQPDNRVHGVVAAVWRGDGRLLLIRRSAHVPAPLKVCFPGGGMDVGESPEQALVREMREELDVLVRPVRQCWRWDSPDKPLTLWGYVAEVVEGEPQPHPHEVAEILWLTPQEAIDHPDAMPTNRDFVATLVACNGKPRDDDPLNGASHEDASIEGAPNGDDR